MSFVHSYLIGILAVKQHIDCVLGHEVVVNCGWPGHRKPIGEHKGETSSHRSTSAEKERVTLFWQSKGFKACNPSSKSDAFMWPSDRFIFSYCLNTWVLR